MHELAIAEAIADVARAHAAGRRVEVVRVRIGHLRQVVGTTLAFGFDLVVRDTPLEGATLEIEAVPVATRCRRCGRESPQSGFPFRCSACGAVDAVVVRGEELQVVSLDLADLPASDRDAHEPPFADEYEPGRTAP